MKRKPLPFSLVAVLNSTPDPREEFKRAADFAVWWSASSKNSIADPFEHLSLLQRPEDSWRWLLFAMRMAEFDDKFWLLNDQMTRETIRRGISTDPVVRNYMADLRSKPPGSGNAKLGRDVCIVFALAIGEVCGWTATHGESRPGSNKTASAAARVAAFYHLSQQEPPSDDTFSKVWQEREEKFLSAKLDASEISEKSLSDLRMMFELE